MQINDDDKQGDKSYKPTDIGAVANDNFNESENEKILFVACVNHNNDYIRNKFIWHICGKEILMHVYTRCKKVKLVDKVSKIFLLGGLSAPQKSGEFFATEYEVATQIFFAHNRILCKFFACALK